MAHTATTIDRDLVNQAIRQFDAGDPALLRELNTQLGGADARRADAVMAVSQNPLSEREVLLSNALFHHLIDESEMLSLALAPHHVA